MIAIPEPCFQTGISNTIGSPVLACRNAPFFFTTISAPSPKFLPADDVGCTRRMLSGLERVLELLTRGWSLRSNPGLKLANAFGVIGLIGVNVLV